MVAAFFPWWTSWRLSPFSSYAIFPDNQSASPQSQLVADLSITPRLLSRSTAYTSMVSCNQTLAIMLYKRSMWWERRNSSVLLFDINENSAVILAPLVPGPFKHPSGALQLAPSMSLLAASFTCCPWPLNFSSIVAQTKIDGHRARWLHLTSDDVRSCSWPHVQDEDATDATTSLL